MADTYVKTENRLFFENHVLSKDRDAEEKVHAAPTPKMALIVGSLVNINGHEHVVERRLRDSWYFLNPKTNEPCCYSDFEIATLQAKGPFYVSWQPKNKTDVALPPTPLNVGERAHASNMRKLEYVEACIKHPDFCRSGRVLIPIAQAIAQKRGESTPAFQSLLI